MDTSNIPGCTYCSPQVASVGLTEAKAKELGHKVKVGKFPFIGNGKAIAMGESEGKALATQTSKATEEISAQVGAIQSATKLSVDSIHGITSTIGRVSEIASAIAAAAG
eukprot:gene5031-biopygen4226